MNSATLAEIKKELKSHSAEDVMKLFIRVIQYKKENKELLNYLIFESQNEDLYIGKIKEEASAAFKLMNTSSYYFAKKTIRKVLKLIKKHIKYSGKKETEVILLLHFCNELKSSGLSMDYNQALANLFHRQIVSIKKAIQSLHEDLQYDYQIQIDDLLKIQ